MGRKDGCDCVIRYLTHDDLVSLDRIRIEMSPWNKSVVTFWPINWLRIEGSSCIGTSNPTFWRRCRRRSPKKEWLLIQREPVLMGRCRRVPGRTSPPD